MSSYLDNNSTTQPLPEVVEAMLPFLQGSFGNPSSPHFVGREARMAVEHARDAVARMVGAKASTEIVFTSCATESISHAFKMACGRQEHRPSAIVVSSVEHAAVFKAAECYERDFKVIRVPVNSSGALDLKALAKAVASHNAFVSLILANNETGVVFPAKEISAICKSHGAILHIDGVQAAGKMLVDVQSLNCDYLSISAHKFHGPKGVGAIYIREGAWKGSLLGGHQENHLRGGTENVPGIVGFGTAAESVPRKIVADIERMRGLRDKLELGILSSVPGTEVNGCGTNRLCNTSNIFFPNKNSADLVDRFSNAGVYVSAGAACTTGGEPSHVLRAMGMGRDRANASIRFSLSKTTTEEDIQFALQNVPQIAASTLNAFFVA